ncbi:MAG: hypothetical protein JW726_14785 [Anaerolineales bacterium]|nr:hypothetical protein [Anaerolineales bacterium]
MYKLVILFHTNSDPMLDERWPQFLRLVEQMPGLQREATCRVERFLSGSLQVSLIHELYFHTLIELQAGMASLHGMQAGQLLQEITSGKVTLLFADHRQDDLENIRKYRTLSDDGELSPPVL